MRLENSLSQFYQTNDDGALCNVYSIFTEILLDSTKSSTVVRSPRKGRAQSRGQWLVMTVHVMFVPEE